MRVTLDRDEILEALAMWCETQGFELEEQPDLSVFNKGLPQISVSVIKK